MAFLTLAIMTLMPSFARADGRLEALEEQAFKEAATLAEPSVVRIETVGGLDRIGQMLAGTGPTTGVVVGEAGDIMTSSFNFASRPASILVTLPSGQRYPARVIATDELRRLTLIKIDLPPGTPKLIPLEPVPRSALRVGQWTVAMGRTYDAGVPNLSVGILSATNRVWGRAIQTDAKISPANYGGPLVDLSGRGIGILVPLSPEKTDETAGVEWYDGGIGFAVPLEDVYASLSRMQSGETLKPGLLGINFREQGLLAGAAEIDRVRPESPAAAIGLKSGDVIVEAEGQPITRVPQLQHIVGRKYAGDTLALGIRRGSETLRLEATLVAELRPFESGYLGILPVRESRSSDAAKADAATAGVEIREVLPDSPAAAAELRRRDVVTGVNSSPVSTPRQLLDLISRLRPGDTAELQLLREGAEVQQPVSITPIRGPVPAELPATAIPAPTESLPAETRVGRFHSTLDGLAERRYWAYVPSQYNPAHQYGLVVWLHSSGDTMEAEIRTQWQQHCDRRGLILVAPLAADISGWTAGETAFVRDLVEDFQKRYSVDPQRIAVCGFADGGRFAWVNTFRHRDLFRGICAISAPLPMPPLDNDPAHRLQICLVHADEDPRRPGLDTTKSVLEDMRYPVHVIAVPGDGQKLPPAATADEIARWLDMLDRI